MTGLWIAFAIGLFVGSTAGVVLMCLLNMQAKDDKAMDKELAENAEIDGGMSSLAWTLDRIEREFQEELAEAERIAGDPDMRQKCEEFNREISTLTAEDRMRMLD